MKVYGDPIFYPSDALDRATQGSLADTRGAVSS